MTSVADTAKADCYSAGERGAMVWWQELRARLLAPLLVWAEGRGICPDHVTFASLVCGLAFCPFWLWPGQPVWSRVAALVALLFHVVLDGLDGPLARHMGIASRRGSFTDTLADQIVVTASALAVMAAPSPGLNVWVGGLYIFLYAMVVAFAMVRNALGVPYSWLIRPRFWVYAWLALDSFLLPGWLDVVVGLFTVILAAKMTSGFIAIRRML
jgi:phosphatidylglycerophosphate synthase